MSQIRIFKRNLILLGILSIVTMLIAVPQSDFLQDEQEANRKNLTLKRVEYFIPKFHDAPLVLKLKINGNKDKLLAKATLISENIERIKTQDTGLEWKTHSPGELTIELPTLPEFKQLPKNAVLLYEIEVKDAATLIQKFELLIINDKEPPTLQWDKNKTLTIDEKTYGRYKYHSNWQIWAYTFVGEQWIDFPIECNSDKNQRDCIFTPRELARLSKEGMTYLKITDQSANSSFLSLGEFEAEDLYTLKKQSSAEHFLRKQQELGSTTLNGGSHRQGSCVSNIEIIRVVDLDPTDSNYLAETHNDVRNGLGFLNEAIVRQKFQAPQWDSSIRRLHVVRPTNPAGLDQHFQRYGLVYDDNDMGKVAFAASRSYLGVDNGHWDGMLEAVGAVDPTKLYIIIFDAVLRTPPPNNANTDQVFGLKLAGRNAIILADTKEQETFFPSPYVYFDRVVPFIMAHEAGHAAGLGHDLSVNGPEPTATNPNIMSYGRGASEFTPGQARRLATFLSHCALQALPNFVFSQGLSDLTNPMHSQCHTVQTNNQGNVVTEFRYQQPAHECSPTTNSGDFLPTQAATNPFIPSSFLFCPAIEEALDGTVTDIKAIENLSEAISFAHQGYKISRCNTDSCKCEPFLTNITVTAGPPAGSIPATPEGGGGGPSSGGGAAGAPPSSEHEGPTSGNLCQTTVPECIDSFDCAGAQTCTSNCTCVCDNKPSCSSAQPCTQPGKECRGGCCAEECGPLGACSSNLDCGADAVCNSLGCCETTTCSAGPGCQSDSDCPTSQECRAGCCEDLCSMGTFCQDNADCSLLTQECQGSCCGDICAGGANPCTSSEACSTGEVCEEGCCTTDGCQGQELCDSNEDCDGENNICVEGCCNEEENCGNGVIDPGETCESDEICKEQYSETPICSNCRCIDENEDPILL